VPQSAATRRKLHIGACLVEGSCNLGRVTLRSNETEAALWSTAHFERVHACVRVCVCVCLRARVCGGCDIVAQRIYESLCVHF